MRVLVVSAHPLPTSFIAALRDKACEILQAHGHEVDSLDLYAEKFDPVLSPQMRRDYLNVRPQYAGGGNLRKAAARRRRAGAVLSRLVRRLPAIMQGYFQRVFLPGVSTVIDEHGLFHRNLQNLKRLAAVSAYGESRRDVEAKGDPPRRFVRDNIGRLIDPDGFVEHHAIYGIDFSRPESRAQFLESVERAFAAW